MNIKKLSPLFLLFIVILSLITPTIATGSTKIWPTQRITINNFFGKKLTWAQKNLVTLSYHPNLIFFINPEKGKITGNLTFDLNDGEIEDVFFYNDRYYFLWKNQSTFSYIIIIPNGTQTPEKIISLENISESYFFTAMAIYKGNFWFVYNDYQKNTTGLFLLNSMLNLIYNLTLSTEKYKDHFIDLDIVKGAPWIIDGNGVVKKFDIAKGTFIQILNVTDSIISNKKLDVVKFVGLAYSKTELWVGVNIYNSSNNLQYFLVCSFDLGMLELPIFPIGLFGYSIYGLIHTVLSFIYLGITIYFSFALLAGKTAKDAIQELKVRKNYRRLINTVKRCGIAFWKADIIFTNNELKTHIEEIACAFYIFNVFMISMVSFIVSIVQLLLFKEKNPSFQILFMLSNEALGISLLLIVTSILLLIDFRGYKISELKILRYSYSFLLSLIGLAITVYCLYIIISIEDLLVLFAFFIAISLIITKKYRKMIAMLREK